MSRQTPLHGAHVALGARMVDFAGWEMPLHYGSQLEEHVAVRSDSGVFDTSHMRAIDVQGQDARGYLRRLLANDVNRMRGVGHAIYGCMLNVSGGVIDDLITYQLAPDSWRLIVNAGTADKDLAWMEALLGGFGGVSLSPRGDLAMLAVQGPKARQRTWIAFPEIRAGSENLGRFEVAQVGPWMVARTGYTGEDGFEILLPAPEAASAWTRLLEAGVRPIGLGARDTLRLEAGMPLYGQEMDDATSPKAAGLAWTVSLTDAERDFVGRAAYEAAAPTHVQRGLLLLDKGVLRPHQRVLCATGEGETTSGSYAPSLSASIALARLPAATAYGDEVTVLVRDRPLRATVVKAPFVRDGHSLIQTSAA